jgi:hypothetical protein
MGRPTPETGGGTPQNQGLGEFKRLSKERGVSWSVKKPEEPKQQPADSQWESYDRFFRNGPMRPAVLEGVSPRRQNGEGNQPTPQKPSEQQGDAEQFQPHLKEQQAREQLGKPPPEGVREEVQPEPAPIHQEHPVDSLDEFRQLARQALIPPVSPEQLERVTPENAANYAAAMRQFDEAVEFLAQSMAEDPLQSTANIIRRYLREREERSKPPEN